MEAARLLQYRVNRKRDKRLASPGLTWSAVLCTVSLYRILELSKRNNGHAHHLQ